jgi:hypothetical protein
MKAKDFIYTHTSDGVASRMEENRKWRNKMATLRCGQEELANAYSLTRRKPDVIQSLIQPLRKAKKKKKKKTPLQFALHLK